VGSPIYLRVPGTTDRFYYEGECINGRFVPNRQRPIVRMARACARCRQDPCVCPRLNSEPSPNTFAEVVRRQQTPTALLKILEHGPVARQLYVVPPTINTFAAAVERQRRLRELTR
jgi:hypothetical protein